MLSQTYRGIPNSTLSPPTVAHPSGGCPRCRTHPHSQLYEVPVLSPSQLSPQAYLQTPLLTHILTSVSSSLDPHASNLHPHLMPHATLISAQPQLVPSLSLSLLDTCVHPGDVPYACTKAPCKSSVTQCSRSRGQLQPFQYRAWSG